MADSTPIPIVSPDIPTGPQLFNAIMGTIEPELTTEGMKTLKEKYKNETPADAGKRKLRYQKAFAQYDEAYAKAIAALQSQQDQYRRASFNRLENDDRASEQKTMNTFLRVFS